MINERYWEPGMTLHETERKIIEREYHRQGGNREQTAKSLGVSPRTISNKIKMYEHEDEILKKAHDRFLDRERALRGGVSDTEQETKQDAARD